jgi:hypothetical protein
MRRSLAALAVTASLLTPASQAHLLGSLWGYLTSLWSTADAGPGLDPDGRNAAPQPTPDAGPGLDPSGNK